jgi:kinesin family protein C1
MRGIIPRAMEKVGEYKLELEAQGWCYTMKISFVEIYNEAIRDLLNESSNAPNVEIKRDQKGVPSLSNTTFLDVDPNDRAMLENIMEVAARHRSVASTDMNAQSSRSHSIFTLYLSARNEERNSQLKGTLHLVDLAGSERLSRSGATGSRLKETQAINKSLSSLSDVFVAIGNKQSHIPFRNSKLTQVLQPCLSGDGKTLMFVNLSPTEESFDETLCSLRFAKHVNNVELGRCKKQVRDLPSSSSSSMREEEQDGEEEESKEERGRGAQRSMKKRPTQTASRDTSVTQKKVRRS